jgi:phospholipid/cholesterol/gamma-HCH transport system ATP-binding protein
MMVKTEDIDQVKAKKYGEPVIEINGVYKSFGSNHVLKDFNLTINRGENVVVLGKSGCGKSVLIKCIIGLLTYDAGSIKVFGNEISQLPIQELDELRARIGFVFQSSALYDSMTVRENLEFPLRRHGKHKSKSEIQDLVEETLKDVGLLNAINFMPSELSGGMRKRIGLARSLILHPEIMLYDEPTTGLDPITSSEIINLMLNVQKKYNTTSITISHDMHCARVTGNRLAVIVNGVNYADGTYDELSTLNDPQTHPFFE